MAAESMKDIKLRIKSVRGTRQITKAMQLVASSKIKRAKEHLESAAPYSDTFKKIIAAADKSGVFIEERPVQKICVCVIAGDRGLAGGYNLNVFKAVEELIVDTAHIILPIGKKAYEHFDGRSEILGGNRPLADLSLEECNEIGQALSGGYKNGDFDRVYLVYTKHRNALIQEPQTICLVPIVEDKSSYAECEPSGEGFLNTIISDYIGAVIYGAAAQSYVSELAARQTAMDSATSNADDMLDDLQLRYNRARQAGITQEITEITAGSGQ